MISQRLDYLLIDRVESSAMNHSIYDKILMVAEALIQSKGYNAFSYKDISQMIGIKTSSIHYYFPTKADLGRQVVLSHLEKLYPVLNQISNNNLLSYKDKLGLFFDNVVAITYDADRKMCLGGILASEVLTLPEVVQLEVKLFFTQLEEWLIALLINGKASDEFNFKSEPIHTAKIIISLLEGALLMARLFEDAERLTQAKQQILWCVSY